MLTNLTTTGIYDQNKLILLYCLVRQKKHSRDWHISVLRLAWLGTALQWCLGDCGHGLIYQNLLILHPLPWYTADTQNLIHMSRTSFKTEILF